MGVFIEDIFKRAKDDKKRIVLPEGDDVRTLEAAEKILAQDIADVIILGDVDDIKASGYELDKAQIIDPSASDMADSLAHELYEIRKAKGMTEEDARSLIENELFFGVMLVKTGHADGMVAGACHSTADVLRPSLQILKTAPNSKIVSSFFVMDVPDCEYGYNGKFIFADCGLNVNPNAEELAHIAISSADSWKSLFDAEPYIAMLSHSSYQSASNDDANKVVEATSIAHELAPELALDGELQLDAAICDDIACKKCPDSAIAGKANILIFPDLDSGNIGYKLVQRLAKADAFGPITQGLAAPVNDLSRGCSADDIVGVVAITCVQAQK